MRIPAEITNGVVGNLGAGVLRGWQRTLRVRLWGASPESDPRAPQFGRNVVYAVWHESILGLVFFGLRHISRAVILVSQHQDGEYITRIVQHLGGCVVRGSSTRGGYAGLRALIHVTRNRPLVMTPDGPRGPRRVLHSGVIYLASRSSRAVVPVGFGYSNAWRARSWDRFALPLPGSEICVIGGDPIRIPADVSEEGIEYWRRRVEAAMIECTQRAEDWAEHGREPGRNARAA